MVHSPSTAKIKTDQISAILMSPNMTKHIYTYILMFSVNGPRKMTQRRVLIGQHHWMPRKNPENFSFMINEETMATWDSLVLNEFKW